MQKNTKSKNILSDKVEYTFEQSSLKALQNIASKMKKKRIAFYFMQTPYRKSSVEYAPNKTKKSLQMQVSACRNIVEINGGFYYDCNQNIPPDSFYIDVAHMNENGAYQVTIDFLIDVDFK